MSEYVQPPSARTVFAHPVSLLIRDLLDGRGPHARRARRAPTVLAARPPAPASAELTSGFSADHAVETLNRLLEDEVPHPMSSEANSQVRDRIGDELTAMGYSVETQTAFVCREA